MKPTCAKSEIEIRRRRVTQQLDRLRSRSTKRNASYYADENAYRRQSKRSRELISDLENELSMLDCPGEYDELPAAVVADELGISYEQVRRLIKLGEITATGKKAHERISRGELERVVTIGAPALLRLGREESDEIFEQAVPHLQGGDLEASERAYKRLEGRESWRGPYAPAFLIGLELARGDLDGAISSMRLVYEYEDHDRLAAVMTCLGRLLRGINLKDDSARELCGQFIKIADGCASRFRSGGNYQRKKTRRGSLQELQRRATYLTTSVMNELQEGGTRERRAGPPSQILDHRSIQIIRDAIYTALYAEFFYEKSLPSRMYVDRIKDMSEKNPHSVKLLKSFLELTRQPEGQLRT